MADGCHRVNQPGAGGDGELVVGVVLKPLLRVGRMLRSCFGDRAKDLIRAGDVRDIDMNDAAAPSLWWRYHPDEQGEQQAHQHASLSFAHILADLGGDVSAG